MSYKKYGGWVILAVAVLMTFGLVYSAGECRVLVNENTGACFEFRIMRRVVGVLLAWQILFSTMSAAGKWKRSQNTVNHSAQSVNVLTASAHHVRVTFQLLGCVWCTERASGEQNYALWSAGRCCAPLPPEELIF